MTTPSSLLVTPTLLLTEILVEGRIREDLKNVEELAQSIADHGLLQPLVVERINHDTYFYALRCGGRRYTALTLLATNKVPSEDSSKYLRAPVVVFDLMPDHKRVLIELEENIRREGMTWQENVMGIVKYHKACKRGAILDGQKWSQQMTGDLLNMSQANVSVAFKVYEEMVAKNEKVLNAESLNDAIKAITEKELDAGQAEQMRRIQLKRAEQAARTSVDSNGNTQLTSPALASSVISPGGTGSPSTLLGPSKRVEFTKEQVAAFYYQGDALTVLPLLAKTTLINHIVCDPPYGIDMDNLSGDSVSRVADTHDVESNLKLIPEFLRVAFDCIAEDGFLAMWYDLDHHEKIAAWAKAVGWRVQRWPLVWCKDTPCSNAQAQYNITKSTEVCYLMRRSEQSIIKNKRSNNFIVGPNNRNASHPFVKPKYLWDAVLDIVAVPGQTIVDPFAGEGSSLASIFQKGCTPIGIEIDQTHINSGLSYVTSQLNVKSIFDDILVPLF